MVQFVITVPAVAPTFTVTVLNATAVNISWQVFDIQCNNYVTGCFVQLCFELHDQCSLTPPRNRQTLVHCLYRLKINNDICHSVFTKSKTNYRQT